MIFEECMQNDKINDYIKEKLFEKTQKILNKELEKYEIHTEEQVQKFNTNGEKFSYIIDKYKQLENVKKFEKEKQELNNHLSNCKSKINITLSKQKILIKQNETEIYIDINKKTSLFESIKYYKKNSSGLTNTQKEILGNVVNVINRLEKSYGISR